MTNTRNSLRQFGVRSAALASMTLLGVTILSGCSTQSDAVALAALPETGLSATSGYEGQIRLSRFLDEPDGYCLDVPGPANAVMLEMPLIAHTCHADPLSDQVFQFNEAGSGVLRWTTADTIFASQWTRPPLCRA